MTIIDNKDTSQDEVIIDDESILSSQEIRKSLILKDVIKLNKKYQKQFPGTSEIVPRDYYRKHGAYSCSKITLLFGSYGNMIKSIKPKKIDKNELVSDVLSVLHKYKTENPTSKKPVPLAYYKKYGKYKVSDITDHFKSYSSMLEDISPKPVEYSREDLNIVKRGEGVNKRYFVTSIIAGMNIDEDFMKSVLHYCKENDAQLVMLTMRGSWVGDAFSEEIYDIYHEYMATDFIFNSNLKAMDFLIRPQQIISLTGISRMSKKGCSIIVGHSKQFLEAVPSRTGSYPHMVYSTGCCNVPIYGDDRIGRIAYQDHTLGGIVVEVVDRKSFHLRPVQADKRKGIVDLGVYYNGTTKDTMESSIVLGDAHIGSECHIAFEKSVEIINMLKCKTIVFNDLIDSKSVSHHDSNSIVAKYDRPEHQQALVSELDYAGNFLRKFIDSINHSAKYISVPSNHPEHLNRYLSEGRFVFDNPFNCKLACELLPKLLDNIDPLQYYFESRKYLKSNEILFPRREDSISCYGWELVHGDLGQNGSRGSLRSHDTSYEKSVSAHSHTPGIFRSSVRVGTLSKLQLSYTAGSASSWLHTNCVLYSNGTYQLINIIDGEWKL